MSQTNYRPNRGQEEVTSSDDPFFLSRVFISSFITLSGTSFAFDQEGRYESHQPLAAEMPLFRQAPDPISEMGKLKDELETLIRAETLLKEVLGEGRYLDFIRTHQITVKSNMYPNRYYTVREQGYIEVVEDGKVVENLCLVPKQPLITQDVVALRKLMIDGSEEEFLKVANHFPTMRAQNEGNNGSAGDSLRDRLRRRLRKRFE